MTCHNVLRLGTPLQVWLLALIIKCRAMVLTVNRDLITKPKQYHPLIPDVLQGYWNAHYEAPNAGLYGSLIDWNRRVNDAS